MRLRTVEVKHISMNIFRNQLDSFTSLWMYTANDSRA